MDEEPPTEELRLRQLDRERTERRAADETDEPEDTHTHRRRADKAEYLRRKLEEREESERDG